MYVFPFIPTNCSDFDIVGRTAIIGESASGNEQRVSHLGTSRLSFKIACKAVLLAGIVDTAFLTQSRPREALYNMTNFKYFFDNIARMQTNKFTLPAFPDFFTTDLVVRFNTDKIGIDPIGNTHCNLEVELITC